MICPLKVKAKETGLVKIKVLKIKMMNCFWNKKLLRKFPSLVNRIDWSVNN